MAVNYAAALKSTRMQDVIAAIDAAVDPGYIEICSAAYAAVLVTITLEDPSFSESGGVITMLGVPKSGVAAVGGTAAVARIKDGDGNTIVSGLTVGTSNANIIFNSVVFAPSQTVTLTSGTITHSA